MMRHEEKAKTENIGKTNRPELRDNGVNNMFIGATKLADAIAAEAVKYDDPTKTKLQNAASAVAAAANAQTGQTVMDTLESVTTAGKYVTADKDTVAA